MRQTTKVESCSLVSYKSCFSINDGPTNVHKHALHTPQRNYTLRKKVSLSSCVSSSDLCGGSERRPSNARMKTSKSSFAFAFIPLSITSVFLVLFIYVLFFFEFSCFATWHRSTTTQTIEPPLVSTTPGCSRHLDKGEEEEKDSG